MLPEERLGDEDWCERLGETDDEPEDDERDGEDERVDEDERELEWDDDEEREEEDEDEDDDRDDEEDECDDEEEREEPEPRLWAVEVAGKTATADAISAMEANLTMFFISFSFCLGCVTILSPVQIAKFSPELLKCKEMLFEHQAKAVING